MELKLKADQDADKKRRDRSRSRSSEAKDRQSQQRSRKEDDDDDKKKHDVDSKTTSYDHAEKKKHEWKEKILEETPYEHLVDERVRYDDHLGSHFWDAEDRAGLNRDLYDHYWHMRHDDGEHGHWEGVTYDMPVHKEFTHVVETPTVV